MICDLVDYALTPQKRSYTNTTASPKSSSDSSFEDKAKVPLLQIPRPLLSQDEKFEASLHAFEFRLLVPEQDSLCHLSQLSQELNKQLFQADKQQHQVSYSLEIMEDNILHDERTTLMLKNVPKYMKPGDLRNILNKDFQCQFDFIYLPADGTNEGNLGYAFVNFISSEVVLKFYRKYNNNKWSNLDKQICQLKYAKLQGKRDLMNQIHE